MRYDVDVPYTFYEDGQNYKSSFTLRPDQPISFQFGGSFNWIGFVTLKGKLHKIVIPQESIYIDPTPNDIKLPAALFRVDKDFICKEINKILDRNMG